MRSAHAPEANAARRCVTAEATPRICGEARRARNTVGLSRAG